MTLKQHKRSLPPTTTFAILSVIIGVSFVPALATDNYSGYKWFSSSVDVCYDSYSLGLINLGYTSVASEIDQARSSWNNLPSTFTLNKVSSCNNWITSANYGNTLILGTTFFHQTFGFLDNVDTEINRYPTWTTSGNCSPSPYTLDYLMRHEFGHWIMFNDEYNTSESTVMYGQYSCTKWDSIKSHDSSSVTSIYG